MADDASVKIEAPSEVVRLWPDGAPAMEGMTSGPEQVFRQIAGGGPVTDMLRNVSEPTLDVFLPDPAKANGVGVIVCPGGGWRILAWEHEGLDMARWLAARGYAAFVLKYRLLQTAVDPDEYAEASAAQAKALAQRAAGQELSPVDKLLRSETVRQGRALAAVDGHRALAIVRQRAKEWGVQPDRVGMMGFSAGAYLTFDVALTPEAGAPLAFCAPIYGGGLSDLPVGPEAPPMFTCVGRNDPLRNSVEGMYEAWSKARRSAEIHIFAHADHGFGMVKQSRPVDRWTELYADWLADRGFS